MCDILNNLPNHTYPGELMNEKADVKRTHIKSAFYAHLTQI